MANLQEAMENVRRLEELNLNNDEQPNIEAPPASITYTCDFDTNFGDKEAFITGVARYMEEAGIHQKLVNTQVENHLAFILLQMKSFSDEAFLQAYFQYNLPHFIGVLFCASWLLYSAKNDFHSTI